MITNTVKIEAIILGGLGISFLGGLFNWLPLCAGYVLNNFCVGIDLHLWIGLGLVALAFIVFTTSVKVS